jgi:nickel transport protein
MKYYIFLFLIFFPFFSYCHEVRHSIDFSGAYVIDVYYADGTKFSFEAYEIYKPGNEKVPYQVGRTNEIGRISFIPDSPGKWRVKVFSDDGHGANFEINVEEGKFKVEKKLDFFEKYSKPIFGLGIILTIFSVLNLFLRRKK